MIKQPADADADCLMNRYSIKSDKQIFLVNSDAVERLMDRDIGSFRIVSTFVRAQFAAHKRSVYVCACKLAYSKASCTDHCSTMLELAPTRADFEERLISFTRIFIEYSLNFVIRTSDVDNRY